MSHSEIDDLKREIASLRDELHRAREQSDSSYYFSSEAKQDLTRETHLPDTGLPAKTVKTLIENAHALDFDQKLNTSSYVNVSFEPEEEEVALMGLSVNLADQTVYPKSYAIHDSVVNMIADLWHCPRPDDFEEYGVYPGAGTVGSTEACLLAGLALKFRWRAWYKKRHGLSDDVVRAMRPNVVISTCYQAAWEKLFKYLDIEPRLVQPSRNTFKIDPEGVRDAIDEKTMGVVCIMGNHYGGQYDPVWMLTR